MKKIFFNIAIICAAAVISSCTGEVDKIFDDSSTVRAEKMMTADREILKSAPNGWRMEFYGDVTYGGYNVFLDFDDNFVTVASEKVGASHAAGLNENGEFIKAVSGYKMEQSQGVILSFAEKNDIFHYFSDPKNNEYGTTGEGFSGDFEFRIISACPDSVVLRGRKTNNKIMMYPVPADKTWEQVYQEIVDTERFMASRSYSLWVNDVDQDVFIYTQYRSLYFQYKDEEDVTKLTTAPYVVTPDGFKFYKSVDVKGTTINSLAKGTTDEYFLDTVNKDVAVWAYVPSLYEDLAESYWFIDAKQVGEFATPYWEKFKTGLKTAGQNKTKLTLYYAMIGFYDNKLGLHIWAGDDADARWGLTITPLNEEGTQVNIKNNTADSNNAGKTYYQKYAFNQACIPFANTTSKGRNFELTTDNLRKPTYIKMTEIENPKNVITVFAEQIMYPFGLDYENDK